MSDTIDHTADQRPEAEPFNPAIHDPPEPAYAPPPDQGMPEENKDRLRELRIAQAAGTMTDEDKAEIATLSLAESDAAGHPAPVEMADEPVIDGPLALHGDVVALFEHMVEVIPALRSMEPMLRRLRARYDGMVNPPVDAEAPSADKG